MPAETPTAHRETLRRTAERLEAAVDRLERELGSTAASDTPRIAALTAIVNGHAAVLSAYTQRRR